MLRSPEYSISSPLNWDHLTDRVINVISNVLMFIEDIIIRVYEAAARWRAVQHLSSKHLAL